MKTNVYAITPEAKELNVAVCSIRRNTDRESIELPIRFAHAKGWQVRPESNGPISLLTPGAINLAIRTGIGSLNDQLGGMAFFCLSLSAKACCTDCRSPKKELCMAYQQIPAEEISSQG
ncbi:hypothetical protein VRRI112168_00480 [Vreelandella rituensis]|uniref:Uncharacterized protein n=1 Tax=Vreelandella rituensis TaxID=2282306 RepID=A0A368UB64_9GAMM|nr:hypothetical protein [Halomonas rituensis]RCV93827.1 hypothetical protein DU506_01330 [Halomonas rituensis]